MDVGNQVCACGFCSSSDSELPFLLMMEAPDGFWFTWTQPKCKRDQHSTDFVRRDLGSPAGCLREAMRQSGIFTCPSKSFYFLFTTNLLNLLTISRATSLPSNSLQPAHSGSPLRQIPHPALKIDNTDGESVPDWFQLNKVHIVQCIGPNSGIGRTRKSGV